MHNCAEHGSSFWRHHFLAVLRQAPDRLAGIVAVDETFVLERRKGERHWSASHADVAARLKSLTSFASRCPS